jgi:hypothetical protein
MLRSASGLSALGVGKDAGADVGFQRGQAMDGIGTRVQRQAWAEQQFGAAALGDARRARRLVRLAAQMAGDSSGSIPQQTGCVADMKAAYRLFASEDVTHAAIMAPHVAQTRLAAGQRSQVFLVQDSAQLNFTSHRHCVGLGPIGRGELRGLHQQNVLAVDPVTRRPLGLLYQAHPRRAQRGKSHTRAAQHKVPLAERESYWWIEAIRTIGPPPAGVRWVHVGDRAEDVFGVYDECRRQGVDWLIRAAHDRQVETPAGTDHLWSYVRGLPGQATRRRTVRGKTSGVLREAELSVAAGPVTIHPARQEAEYRDCAAIPCWAVRVWEADPPAEAETLEWILLTSLASDTPARALFASQGYSLRWLVEEFHKAEKTGCNVELRRLEHRDRLLPLIGLLSVLAVWLLRLKYAARDEPDAPATTRFDPHTVHVMARYLKQPLEDLTLGAFWHGIGQLGGHLGRKRDGPIGWLRAWRGWQSFQLILLGATLADEDP